MSRAGRDVSRRDGDPYAPPERELKGPAAGRGLEYSWGQVWAAILVFALGANLIVTALMFLGALSLF